jgi:hypothetical protein
LNLVYSRGFFGDDIIENDAETSYNFYIDLILKFENIFNYSMDINSILELPYCLFQDIIIRASEKKRQTNKDITKLSKEIKFGQRK